MTLNRNLMIALALVTALTACGRKQRGSDGTSLPGTEIAVGGITTPHAGNDHDVVVTSIADVVASSDAAAANAALAHATPVSPNLDLLEAGRPAHDIVCATTTDGKADPTGYLYSRWTQAIRKTESENYGIGRYTLAFIRQKNKNNAWSDAVLVGVSVEKNNSVAFEAAEGSVFLETQGAGGTSLKVPVFEKSPLVSWAFTLNGRADHKTKIECRMLTKKKSGLRATGALSVEKISALLK